MTEQEKFKKIEQLINSSSIPADLRYPVIYDHHGNKVTGDLYEYLMMCDLKSLYIEDVKTRQPLYGKYLELLAEGKEQEADAFEQAHKERLDKEYDEYAKTLDFVRYGYTCVSIDGLRAEFEFTPHSCRNEEWERTDAWQAGVPYKLRIKLADLHPGFGHPVVGKKHLILFMRTPGGRLFVLKPYKIY